MLETILKALKTKYANLGLSEAVLKVVAERLATTVKEETEVTDAVESVSGEMKVYQSLEDRNRTLAKENETLKGTDQAAKDQAAKDKAAQEAKDKAAGKDKPGEEVPAWALALIEQNNTLAEKVNGMSAEKINKTNEEKLTSKLKELGVNENFYALQIEGKTFTNDEDINSFAEKVKASSDAFLQSTNDERLKAGVISPTFGGAAITEGKVSSDVSDYITKNFKQNEAN